MNLHAFFREENPKVKLELFKNKSEEVYPLADIRIHRRKSTKTSSPLTLIGIIHSESIDF